MEKYTVTKILATYEKSKDGKAFITKNNKPYKKANVNFTETGDKKVTVMIWEGEKCEVNQVYEGNIEEREWQGNKYYDLKVPSKKDAQRSEMNKLSFTIDKHDFQIKELQEIVRKLLKGEKVEMPKDDYPKLEKMPDFGEGKEETEDLPW